jgi:hypothetical protein
MINAVKTTFISTGIFVLLVAFQNCAPFRPVSQGAKSSGILSFGSVEDFQCKPNSDPRPTDVRRLTRLQFNNTLKDLIRGLTAQQKSDALDAITVTLPSDDDTVFDRTDNSISNSFVFSYYTIVSDVAKFITSTAGIMNSFVSYYINLNKGSDCATIDMANLTAACRGHFIENFGLRVFRRPLTSAEVTKYTNVYTSKGSAAASVSAVMFRLLMAPQFLMLIENNGSPIRGNLVKLSPYELASRLSYQFWNTMPDEDLLADAKSCDIINPEKYPAIVERVFSNAKTKSGMKSYFTGYLGLNKVPTFTGQDKGAFKYLGGSVEFDDALRTAMINEASELAEFVTLESNGNFRDLYTSNVSFARSPALMALYGISTAAPNPTTVANAVRLPASERAGILTRAALLSAGQPYESPIRRGVHILEDFLCAGTGSPDGKVTADDLKIPPLDPNKTTRDRFTQKTAKSMCLQCHFKINNVGFGLNNYNGLGQFRTEEAIFDDEGGFIQKLPVDGHVDITAVTITPVNTSSSVEFSKALASTMYAEKCMSRKYYNFTYGRTEDENMDGCTLQNSRKKLDDQQMTLKDFFMSVALDPAFSQRVIAP